MNGDNETDITMSSQISHSYFDSNNQKIEIRNLPVPIDIYIQRNPNLKNFVDTSFKQLKLPLPNDTSTDFNLNQVKTFLITLAGKNVSLQLQLQPVDLTNLIGYLFLVRFGNIPTLTPTTKSFDFARIFCPNQLQTDSNDKFYQFFLNMTAVNGFNGKLGFGLRELTNSEMQQYCSNNTNNGSIVVTNPPLVANPSVDITFNRSLTFRSITSGCYYMVSNTTKWATDGLEVIEDGTNSTSVHCISSHLTEFAGGFLVLPEPIDFDSVFANASFDKNPLIYATVITIIALFILCSILCYFLDKRDLSKTGICILEDEDQLYGLEDVYYYEMIVMTGNRKDAATDSKVKFVLSGEEGETQVKKLEDPSRKILRRGGVDSFIIGVKK